jgi:uncharacterized protein (DUF488 family)
MLIYTIGYGGRKPEDFLGLLRAKGVRAVVDVRLRPDSAYTPFYAKAKTPKKAPGGKPKACIERTLAGAEIQYFSLVELGNLFDGLPDWQERYKQVLDAAGDLLTERLSGVPEPFCLLCVEKLVAKCHRRLIAEFLAAKGHQIEHIE